MPGLGALSAGAQSHTPPAPRRRPPLDGGFLDGGEGGGGEGDGGGGEGDGWGGGGKGEGKEGGGLDRQGVEHSQPWYLTKCGRR